MALQTPEQQAKLLGSLFDATLAEFGEFDTEIQEHADPMKVWERFQARVSELGLRLAVVDAEPTSLPGRSAAG